MATKGLILDFKAAVADNPGRYAELRGRRDGPIVATGQIAACGEYDGKLYLVLCGSPRGICPWLTVKEVQDTYSRLLWCRWTQGLLRDVAYFFALPDSPSGLRFYWAKREEQWSPADYPHDCPRCGAAAYVGAVPASAVCTGDGCPLRDPALD